MIPLTRSHNTPFEYHSNNGSTSMVAHSALSISTTDHNALGQLDITGMIASAVNDIFVEDSLDTYQSNRPNVDRQAIITHQVNNEEKRLLWWEWS